MRYINLLIPSIRRLKYVSKQVYSLNKGILVLLLVSYILKRAYRTDTINTDIIRRRLIRLCKLLRHNIPRPHQLVTLEQLNRRILVINTK